LILTELEVTAGTQVNLPHRAIGLLDPAHRADLSTGWQNLLNLVPTDFSKRKAAHRV